MMTLTTTSIDPNVTQNPAWSKAEFYSPPLSNVKTCGRRKGFAKNWDIITDLNLPRK